MSSVSAARPSGASSVTTLAVGVNAGLAVAAACLWLGMALRGDFWQADFSAFYTGWSMALQGQAPQLYDLSAQAEWQGRLVPERTGLLPFVHPPHAVLPFALLALLPLHVAFYVWTALQVGMLALALRWLRDEVQVGGPAALAVATATMLAFPPLFLTFQLGQFALVSLVCLLGLWRSLRHDRALSAAAWLVLASVKPQFALLPAAYLLGAGRWRSLGYAGGLFIAWAGLTTLFLGWRCWPDFLEMTAFHARQFDTFGIYPLRGHNVKMVLAALLGSEQLPLINALSAVAFALAAVAALALGKGAGHQEESRFALVGFLAVLCAPHLNPHDALLLVVPGVLLYVTAQNRRAAGTTALLLTVCPLLFLVDSFGMDWWPSRVRPFFLVVAALTAWSARHLECGGAATIRAAG